MEVAERLQTKTRAISGDVWRARRWRKAKSLESYKVAPPCCDVNVGENLHHCHSVRIHLPQSKIREIGVIGINLANNGYCGTTLYIVFYSGESSRNDPKWPLEAGKMGRWFQICNLPRDYTTIDSEGLNLRPTWHDPWPDLGCVKYLKIDPHV